MQFELALSISKYPACEFSYLEVDILLCIIKLWYHVSIFLTNKTVILLAKMQLP